MNIIKKPTVLIIDDEPAVLISLSAILEKRFSVLTTQNSADALQLIKNKQVDVVFLDILMPDRSGIEILKQIKDVDKNLCVIIATAVHDPKTIVKAMKLGAFDYITKPFDNEEVNAMAEKALEQEKLIKEVITLRSQIKTVNFSNIVGKNKAMADVYSLVKKVIKNNSTILISGESGTGKELVARAIHFNSERKDKAFIAVNCAGIPDNLLESELFGYEKGAFSGAINQKMGMFELADEGTLFLDEISGLKMDMQAKLLRVIQEKEIMRLGGTKTIATNIRIISATNIDLKEAIKNNKFREDLYYRLNVIPIHIPPLRNRKDDIPLLVEHFIAHYNKVFLKNISGISNKALELLVEYDWPGNVRELKNIIERIVVLKDNSVIEQSDLPLDIFINKEKLADVTIEGGLLKDARKAFEKQYIQAVLDKVGGNQIRTSKILGIHRNALAAKMKDLGLKKCQKQKR